MSGPRRLLHTALDIFLGLAGAACVLVGWWAMFEGALLVGLACFAWGVLTLTILAIARGWV